MNPNHIEFIFGCVAVALNGINFFVLIVLFFKPRTTRSTYIHQFNLAISDLCVGIFLIIKEYYTFNGRSCTIVIGFGLTAVHTSLFGIALFTIDRFFYLYHEVYYETWFNVLRTIACVISIWILAFAISCFPLTWSRKTRKTCDFLTESRQSSLIFRSIIGLAIILFIIYMSSFIAYRQIRNYPTVHLPSFFYARARSHYNSTASRSYIITKSILIMSAITILWTPHTVFSIYYDFQDKKTQEDLQYLENGILLMMLYFNSITNPILHTWCHYGFYAFILDKCLPKIPDNMSIRSSINV